MILKKLVWLQFLQFFAASLAQSDRCGSDEVCQHIKNCVEMKFFLSRNAEEIEKMKVCGTGVETREYCCKVVAPHETDLRTSNFSSENTLTSHKNIKLINNARCGKAIGDRIFFGTVPKVGSLPWMVLLYYKSDFYEGQFKCGGSLISAKYVLTAAHCLYVPHYKLFSVRLGEHRISTDHDCTNASNPITCNNDDPPIQDIEVEKTIIHEGYVHRGNNENDIALLQLKTDAILKRKIKNVRTICLPVSFDQSIDALMEEEAEVPIMNVAGWGYTEEDVSVHSDVLMQASMPYVPNIECGIKYNDLKTRNPRMRSSIHIKDSFMCAGGLNKTDVCSGDSGSPLTYHALNDKGLYKVFQQGIVSTGIACTHSEMAPGIYTRVYSFMEWILDNMED